MIWCCFLTVSVVAGAWAQQSASSSAPDTQEPSAVSAAAIGPAFTVNKDGVRIAGSVFVYRITLPELRRYPTAAIESLVRGNPAASEVSRLYMQDLVAEVRNTGSGDYEFLDVAGETSNTSIRLHSGDGRTIDPRMLRGTLYFGDKYVAWPFEVKGAVCRVELQHCVLLAQKNEIHGDATTRIRSQQCYLPIGAYEFKGEIGLTADGVKVLAGGSYRKR